MDNDDRQGYLQDFVLGWAKENNVNSVEDLKNLAAEFPEFVQNVLETAGVLPDDLGEI